MEASGRLEQKYTEMSQQFGVYGMVGIFFAAIWYTDVQDASKSP